MASSNNISSFPVFLVQEVIEKGRKNIMLGTRIFGDKYADTMLQIISIQGKATFDCFDKIFKVPDNQMVEVPDDFFNESTI